MTHSDSIKTIAPALLAAQTKIGGATKGKTNPFFKSKYADLGAVMEACKDPLNENGITVLQPIGSDEQGVYVETVLLHESGEFIADRMRIAAKSENNPQDQGSAITYARRYSLQSMVFIPAEDDDAEKAVAPLRKPPTEEDGPATNGVKAPAQPASEHFCTIHNKPMKERQDTRRGTYWDHRWQDEQKVWQQCNGKPTPEELDEDRYDPDIRY